METHISESQEFLKIHRKSCQHGGILLDDFMSLKHGLKFLELFFDMSPNDNITDDICNLVPYVKEKLDSLVDLRKDESLCMKLDSEYSDIREEMKNVIIKTGSNKYQVLFPESFSCHAYVTTSSLLCEIIDDCKADQIRLVMKELEGIRRMVSLLEPFFEEPKPSGTFLGWNLLTDHAELEKEKRSDKIFSTVAAVMERVACFIYLSAVGKMDDEMVIYLKNISSDLILEETQIMEMYLSLDIASTANLESHVSMSLRLLEWNKRCYLGTEMGEALEDHFTSIEHGLQYLVKILRVSTNNDLRLRVQHLVAKVKKKLYSLPHNHNDENLNVNLEHAYGELREEMKNVIIKPGTDDYDTLFPKFLTNEYFGLEEIMESLKLTLSSQADQVTPMIKETKELRKKFTSLKPLFDNARIEFRSLGRFKQKPEEIKVSIALTAFLDRATCLIYFSLVAKLNEHMFVSLRKNISLLIEKTEIKKMALNLEMKTCISESQELLEIHRKTYQSIVTGGILLDHFISLKHGLQFLGSFCGFCETENLTDGIRYLVFYVKQKLYSFSHLRKDESLFMKLDRQYSDLREEMKNVIINPGIKKYHVLFLESFNCYAYKKISLLLCEIIEELMSSDCKAGQIRPVKKELEDIKKMLYLLEPFFEYEKHAEHFDDDKPWGKPFAEHEKEKKILSTVAAVMERVTCFICLSAVGKMDDEMVISLKNISSDLILEETQIMKMYLSLDVDSIENLESHIFMSLRLLGWNKRCYLGTELGEALEGHFTSIEHGLLYLVKIFKVSENEDLKFRVLRSIKIVKHKLYSLPHNQRDENLKVNLDRAYGELREEMKNVVIKPGTNDYDTLFPKVLESNECVLLLKIMESLKLTSSCEANQIAPVMKEIKELRKKLRSLKPLFNYARIKFYSLFRFTQESEEIRVNVVLTAFLDRATCLIYLSLVAQLNEDMFLSLRKNFSLLIEEIEIKKMSRDLGIIFEDDFESDIDTRKCPSIWEDHIISLKHGIEFLKWFSNIYNFDEDLKRCIILLARNVRQKLELLTYKQEDESLNMDVNGACAVLREEMKNVIISQRADKYESLFPELKFDDSRLVKITRAYLRRTYDFLVEKITTLVTSNCKADRIAPLKKELQDLQKRLKIFRPLILYICGIGGWKKQILKTLLTFLCRATFLIYLTFVGTMDIEMVLSVKSSISIAIKETDDVQEIYTLILNQFLSKGESDDVEELYLLENLMILLEEIESLDDKNIKLYEALNDIHSFLLALPRNVILRKLHLLEDILRHSIPIVYSCYLKPTEVDISVEFNCVFDLIKHIKSEAVEMKLYYFPRVDDLGFLKFFLGYLEDLMKNQEEIDEILMKEEIDALHVEVNTLLSLAKKTNQEELDKKPLNDMMNLAYQAEYIIDLYLVSSPRDSGLISSLSKIIQQLHNIRADVTWDLSHLCQSLPAQDVAAETSEPQVKDNDGIVGLQEETKNIMEDLLKGENKLTVVAIIGMAGVGKTTMASSLYKTPLMADRFDILSWCTVSQSYESRALLLSILDQVNAPDKSHRSISDDQNLKDHICRSLKKRRYLILLDDIWDTTLWNYLRRYLPDDMNGSRILITTRNRDVADQIASKVNELKGLSEASSWELFRKKMLKKKSLPDHLLKIAEGIVKHCKGLPLSIVIIAGILSDIERTEEKWNQIARKVSSAILSDPQGECEAILKLSYNHLPNHLRSCFLYLGSFPEDQEISVNHLIFLWIGEGFVQDTEIDTAEEVAKMYVEDLVVKSLVIPAKKRSGGGVKTFRLHDLLRDFCLGIAKEKHFITLLGKELFDKRKRLLALQDPRRIIMSGADYQVRKKVDFSCHSVRSMICHGRWDAFEINKRIGSCDMVLLRVLEVNRICSELFSVADVHSNNFPDISSLVHLRYLAFLSGNWSYSDSVFPSSISKLQNLQILILKSADFKVPDFIWDMVNLRHIHIDEASFEVDCNRLQNSSVLLENLISLSSARVSYDDSKWLSKLSRLQRLCCAFMIDDPEVEDITEANNDIEVDDVTTVEDTKMDDVTEVGNDTKMDDVTEVNDDIEVDDVTEVEDTKRDDVTEVDDDVKDSQSRILSFNGTLVSLKVKNSTRRVQRFISTCQLPKSLRKLTLSNFYLESNDFSIIGKAVPHLEVFKIYECNVPSGYEWNVDDEDFPKLKVLKLSELGISMWNVSEDSFPSLEQLWVDACYSLDVIPPDFGYLLKLRLISVRRCAPSIVNSAREIEKVQHEEQNTEMRVHTAKNRFDEFEGL